MVIQNHVLESPGTSLSGFIQLCLKYSNLIYALLTGKSKKLNFYFGDAIHKICLNLHIHLWRRSAETPKWKKTIEFQTMALRQTQRFVQRYIFIFRTADCLHLRKKRELLWILKKAPSSHSAIPPNKKNPNLLMK